MGTPRLGVGTVWMPLITSAIGIVLNDVVELPGGVGGRPTLGFTESLAAPSSPATSRGVRNMTLPDSEVFSRRLPGRHYPLLFELMSRGIDLLV